MINKIYFLREECFDLSIMIYHDKEKNKPPLVYLFEIVNEKKRDRKKDSGDEEENGDGGKDTGIRESYLGQHINITR